MKFDQLIKYNKENIFLKRLYRKCGGGTIPKFFGNNQNWAGLWIDSLKY